MAKTKKRWGYLVLIVGLLIIALINSYLILAGSYAKFSQINALLSSSIIIKNHEFSGSTIFLIVQWIIILLLEILVFRGLNRKTKESRLQETYIRIKENHGRFNTELDSLYGVIKEHEEIKLEQIVNAFKITEEKALEWIKILENSNLVTIEYPAFGSPVVRIK